jgi:hypothetical protein
LYYYNVVNFHEYFPVASEPGYDALGSAIRTHVSNGEEDEEHHHQHQCTVLR